MLWDRRVNLDVLGLVQEHVGETLGTSPKLYSLQYIVFLVDSVNCFLGLCLKKDCVV